ncbi:hypothetical protein [Pseudoalteromonas rubra]|uniref:hypothetical protein n=1 Tax=Pseudoalteromonas rubra TaxID=43658 RepID=UPI0013DDA53B|nr:hypothetical protein [Pseudoalteromonas rubra]
MKFIVTLLFLFSFKALACSCLGYDIEKAFNNYPIVVIGTVEKVETIKTKEEGWFNYSYHKAVTLVVDHSYKGLAADKILVTTRMDSAACGYPFQENVKYAVFAYPNEKGLHVGSCGPTIHIDKREEYYEKERLYVTEFLSQKHGI